MNLLLSPTGFLKIGGVILVALGLIGITGVTNDITFFNLDTGENVAHIFLGVVALVGAFGIRDARAHRILVAIVAVTGLFFGVYGFFLPAGDFMHGNFLGLANLENPADNLLHLVVGTWAAGAAWLNREPTESMVPRAA